jgi:hypothetical protein
MCMPRFDYGHQASIAGAGAALRVDDVPIATRAYHRQGACRRDGVAGFRDRRSGVETNFGRPAVGEKTRAGTTTGSRPLRSGVCTAGHGVPDLSPGDDIAGRGETVVVPWCPAIGSVVARYAGTFAYVPWPGYRFVVARYAGTFAYAPADALSPPRPIAHRPRQSRDRGYHAPCMTRHAPAPGARTLVRRASGWHPIYCPASGSAESR